MEVIASALWVAVACVFTGAILGVFVIILWREVVKEYVENKLSKTIIISNSFNRVGDNSNLNVGDGANQEIASENKG